MKGLKTILVLRWIICCLLPAFHVANSVHLGNPETNFSSGNFGRILCSAPIASPTGCNPGAVISPSGAQGKASGKRSGLFWLGLLIQSRLDAAGRRIGP